MNLKWMVTGFLFVCLSFQPVLAAVSCDTTAMKSLAKEVIASDVTDCKLQKGLKCFKAGEFWNQFWVRDTSYSTFMGLYKLYPQELKNTFKELVMMNGKKGYPIQDPAADFGAFPNQTDSVVWLIGAFELAKNTGDEEFRKYVYGVGKKMRDQWMKAVDPKDGLLFGAPSFLDSWASFPESWKGHPEVFLKNKFLSTNVLWLRFEQILLFEGKRYGDLTPEQFKKEEGELYARMLNFNIKFYDVEKKYYRYYLGSEVYEGLGNTLLKKFGLNFFSIQQVLTDENFYPAHFPMYPFKIPGNWYSETAQHVWVDAFAATVEAQPLDTFCAKYASIFSATHNIGELVAGGRMFGGMKQLWSATAVYFYLEKY